MRPVLSSCAVTAAILLSQQQTVCHAQDWLRQAIAVEDRTHDFGTVARAANTEHRFHITNTTQKPIHLSHVRASCGCTTPIIETDWIQPGETGTILARFNTGTFTGQKAATLTVSIDQPYRTELQLNVRGYIRSDIVLSPGEAAFGEVPVGEEKVLELTLDYAGRNDWTIERIDCPLEFASVDFEEISRGGGRVKYKITAKITDKAPIGFIANQLVLQTNDRRLTTVPIRLLADIQSPIQFSPKNLALGELHYGDSVPQRLVVKGPKAFKILEITSPEVEVGFSPIVEAKPNHLLNLNISPKSSRPGKVKGRLVIETDLMDEPTQLGVTYELLSPEGTSPEPNIEVQAAN